MIESSDGTSQGQDTQVSSPGVTPSAPPVQSAQSTSDERTFRQNEVNDLVKRAKSEAVDTYRRMQVEQPEYLRQKYGDSVIPKPHTATFDESHYRKIAAEEAQRLRDQWVQDAQSKSEADMAQRIVQNFQSKVAPGREKYDDFDKVTGNINLARFPNVVQLIGDYVDNSPDVMYELGKNRMKMDGLENLANRSPEDAIYEIQRLAQSLKDNEAAGKVRTPNAPLSQMRPSNTGTDNGVMSVKDYRARYKV